jgi:hypothetical protein
MRAASSMLNDAPSDKGKVDRKLVPARLTKLS